MQTILIVDGTNLFIRSFVKDPTADSQGNFIGGMTGFIKSLHHFIGTTEPAKIVVVFDGCGGSKRRRRIFGEYKSGRKPARLNRSFELSDDEHNRNRVFQALKLRQYLQFLPVTVLEIPDVEADDVIAFVANHHDNARVCIASNDADFEQLVSERVCIFKPTKHAIFGIDECVAKYSIFPHNLAVAKSFVGDRGDNIDGVKGIGFKNVVKLLPLLKQKEMVSFEDLRNFIDREDPKKYARFLNAWDLVLRNYELIQLKAPLIGSMSMSHIREDLEMKSSLNLTRMRLQMKKDGIMEFGERFFTAFRSLA